MAAARIAGPRSELRAMRWCATALAPGVSRQGRRIGGAALACALGLALICSGAAATGGGKASSFTGYAFDSCNAPKLESLQAWLASPYRALGAYIGGANRACPNGQLSPEWAAGAVALGWNLIPIYVGLQAPCAGGNGLARIVANSATSLGTAAADDAAADSGALGLPQGSPIYFDMEAYSLHNPSCSQAVEDFTAAWTTELHALGYLSGIYGSAASTIRDVQVLQTTAPTSAPDDIWIADWNGVESVFGNPYVADTLWPNHQRLHQYRGGHHETWGGVTIDVDSNYVDGAVVGATGIVVPAPAPLVTNPSVASAAGSVSSTDGVSKVSWPAGAFQAPVVVSLTPAQPTVPVPGFGSGGYGVQLQVSQNSVAALSLGFAMPLTIHVGALPGTLAPMSSKDGVTWTPLRPLVAGALPVGAKAGFIRNRNGSFDIETTVDGYFALLPELTRPPAPASLGGHFSHGRLVLKWPKSESASGPAVSYKVTLTNSTLLTQPQTTASLTALHHTSPSVFRIVATDAAGKDSEPSKPLVVLPSNRPPKLPKIIPHWAFELSDWQQGGKVGTRPAAPKIPPDWYWRWYAWHAAPFHIRT
ncbi:MAG TPA: DUF1906 domain-containing protein [Gaiellaceae bacterium]